MSVAESYKLKGNELFRHGDYAEAAKEYSNAIIKDPTNPAYYTNRANAFLKLKRYEEAAQDSQRAIDLNQAWFKGHYFLGKAALELGRLKQAETHLKVAYEHAIQQNSSSAPDICQTLLETRKRQWEQDEKRRVESSIPMLLEIRDMYNAKLETDINAARSSITDPEELADEIEYLTSQTNQKIENITTILKRNSESEYSRKEVPEYLVDPISFNLFVDPVIAPSGQTFERSWIMQHLKSSNTDPFSRQYLSKERLVPNLQLRAAAEDFIKKEGTY